MLIRSTPTYLDDERLFAAEDEGGKSNGQGDANKRATQQHQEDKDQDADDQRQDAEAGDQEEDPEAELKRLRRENDELKRLKPHHERIMKEKKRLSEYVKQYNGLGSPDEIREKLTEAADSRLEHEATEARKTGDTDRLMKTTAEKHARELDAKDVVITSMQARIERLTINQSLRNALASVKVDPDLMDGAFALLRPKMKLIETDPDADEDDGYMVVARVDDDELPINDYVKSLAEADPKFQRYLLQPASTGGGANPGKRGDVMIRKPRSKMTLAEKTAFIEKYTQEAYLKLPYD